MSALRVERDGEILRVTLARPERRNAFDADLIRELGDAFADVGDARAVVLAGEGPSFCAGADVEWQRSSIDLSYEENVEDYRRLYQMLQAIFRCPAPVIVRVHGFALGGGSGLTACADICIAAEDAVFGFSEVRLGIIPGVISPMVLAKIGPAAARRYFLTGERFDAQTALRIGLVDEVAADPDEAVSARRRLDPRRRADRRPRGETARARAGRGGGPAGAGSRAADERRRSGRAAGVSRLPRRRARLPGVASRPRLELVDHRGERALGPARRAACEHSRARGNFFLSI